MNELHWVVILNCGDKQKARKLLDRIAAVLEVEITADPPVPYPKVDKSFRVTFTTSLDAASPPEAVFSTLQLAGRLAHGLSTSGPQVYDGGLFEFDVMANGGFAVPGVTFMTVALGTTDNFIAEGE